MAHAKKTLNAMGSGLALFTTSVKELPGFQKTLTTSMMKDLMETHATPNLNTLIIIVMVLGLVHNMDGVKEHHVDSIKKPLFMNI